ncbi:hypothetical protein FRC16_005276 [Serendipita sp. 398]|nr:hypothetical protein FRC16_005276 [Serendipita sp. 398]
MYLAFVNNALKAKSEGNSSPFEELRDQFSISTLSNSPLDFGQLKNWLLALSHVVSQLDKRHVSLVEAIVHMPWTTTTDETFVKSYIGFLGMLVSARTEWANIIVASAIRRLTHHSPLNVPPKHAESIAPGPPITLRTIFERAHLLLQTLLELIPTLPSTLSIHLLRCFPHKTHSVSSHIIYCKNLVKLMGYCPQIVEPALSLIVERAVGIDVEIQIELEELEELAASGEDQGNGSLNTQQGTGLLSNFDPFDTVAGQESDSDDELDGNDDGLGKLEDVENFSDVSSEVDFDSEDGSVDKDVDPKEVERRAARVKGMVAKLDGIMGLLLKWLERTAPSIRSTSIPTQHPHFVTLLSIFDRTILTTFKSRYTQFLLFYLVSQPSEPFIQSALAGGEKEPSARSISNPHTDIFLGSLLHNTLMPQTPPVPMLTRVACASYLASFVSRALCVSRDDCRRVMAVCCQWADGHLTGLENVLLGTDSSLMAEENEIFGGVGGAQTELGVFYAITQAIFLVFCFRWRDLLEAVEREEDEDEEEEEEAQVSVRKRRWMVELNVVQRLIVSPLNPLKVCSPNVVQQFSRVSEKIGFVYCRSILESNRRSSLFPFPLSSSSYSGAPTTPIRSGPGSGSGGPPSAGPLTPSPLISVPSTPLGVSLGGLNPFALTAVSSMAMAMGDLQTFFPFDPYRLPISCRWFEKTYRDWGMVAIEDDDDDDDDDEEEEEEEEEEEAEEVMVQDESGNEEEDEEEVGKLTRDESSDDEGIGGKQAPMELGSVRRQSAREKETDAEDDDDEGSLMVSTSFGKMSISPDRRLGGGGLRRLRVGKSTMSSVYH